MRITGFIIYLNLLKCHCEVNPFSKRRIRSINLESGTACPETNTHALLVLTLKERQLIQKQSVTHGLIVLTLKALRLVKRLSTHASINLEKAGRVCM